MSTLTDMVDSYLTPNPKEGETIDLSQFTPRQRTNIRLYGLDFKDFTAIDIANYKSEWMKNCEKVDLATKEIGFGQENFVEQTLTIKIFILNFKQQILFSLKTHKMHWYSN